ncbi:MAG: LytTR family transcriptional regulator [Paludibacteraceae bacterium]|nr:LytTR family transcriptional regulator [Paludibacteraceae bacterium]
MAKIPNKLLSVPSLLAHVLVIPAFLLFFVLIYSPGWIVDMLDMGAGRKTFNLLMVMCIILGVLCVSRIPVTSVRRHLHNFSWLRYILWCMAEVACMSAFVSLYLTLVARQWAPDGGESYFTTLGWTAALVGSIVIYPYLLLNFLLAILEKPDPAPSEDELVRLYDSYQQLKLVVASSAIVYIEAAANYLIIKYTEGERVKDYQLRNTMKTLEPMLQKHGIIRCQRSFFVNPRHVTALRKDKEGLIVAELDIREARPIPVSPNYYDNLSRLL